jgi:PIN domain nuclease of toxin-antitoxin system
VSRVIYDSSTLLALINNEPGSSVVEKYLSSSTMSSVNVSEVVKVLLSKGMPLKSITEILSELIVQIIPFTEKQAYLCGTLFNDTKEFGLSLGDRACIGLGLMEKAPILTADKAWGKLKTKAEIRVIR